MKANSRCLTSLVLSVLLFCGLTAAAQVQEPQKLSPEQQLERLPNDTSRITPLFYLANSYIYRDSAKAIHYVKEALVLSRKYNKERAVCNFLLLWGEVYVAQNNFPAAVEKLKEAKALAIRIHNLQMEAQEEDIMGVICNAQGDYTGAINHYIEHLHAGEQLKDTTMIQVGNVNICVTYMNEKNYPKAIEYAHRTLQFPYNPQRILSVTKALEMISEAYIEQHNYAPARDSLQKALLLYQEAKNEMGIATIYSVLAGSYPADAYKQLEYALPAQQMWERLAPNNGYSISNLASLGVIYAYFARVKAGAVKDTGALRTDVRLNGQETPASLALREATKLNAAALAARARKYYTVALDRATQGSDRDGIIQITDSLANLEAFDGHYKEAFTYLQQHDVLFDSVYSQENKNKVAGIEADYKVELSDKQLQINKLALSNQIRVKWLLISSLALVLLVMVLVYRQSRLRKRTNASLSALNEQLNEANAVKTKFFGILNHDLRSPVASLITLLRLREREPEMIDEQAVKARTEKITVAAEDLLETMEDLLIWSKGQMEQFRPKMKPVAIAELFQDIDKRFASGPVSLHFEQPPELSVITDKDFAKTILRNLTGNAIKALNGEERGRISWKAWESGGKVWLSITDNGPGATKEQLSPLFEEDTPVGIRNGLGLHIVRDMAKAIGWEVQVHSPAAGGLEVRLLVKPGSSDVKNNP